MTHQRISAFISIALATGIAIAAMLGPLLLGVIRFRMTDLVENQYVGGEIVSLFVVAPTLVVAGLLWLRGDRLAPALAFGPALYTVYTFVTAILGQDYTRFPGNAEKAFPLYTALVAGGFALAFLASLELARLPAPMPPVALRRAVAGVFLVIALFFALAWSGQIVMVYRGETPSEYVDSPTLFWLVKLMDLGFLLPALTVMGIGLLRRQPLAIRMSYGLVGYAVCMAGAVLGMAIAMFLRDDPAASVGMVAFLLPVTVGLVILAARMLALYRKGHVVSHPERVMGARHAS